MPSYENSFYNPYIVNNDYLADLVGYSAVRANSYNGYSVRETPAQGSKEKGNITFNSFAKGAENFLKDKSNQQNLLTDAVGITGMISNNYSIRKAVKENRKNVPNNYTQLPYNDNYLGFAESNYGEVGVDDEDFDTYGQWNYPEQVSEEEVSQTMFDPFNHDDDILSQYLLDDDWDEPITFTGEAYSRKNGNTDKYDETVDYLVHKGLPANAAHGIAANIAAESNFNTEAVGDGGKARGVAQWHPDRYNALSQKFNLKDFYGSLDAILHELKSNPNRNGYNELLEAKNPYEATDIFQNKFERPANQTKGIRYKYLR